MSLIDKIKSSKLTPTDYFALIIGPLAVGISTVQTAKGWIDAFGFISISIVFSIIVSGALIYLNLLLRESKQEGLYLKLLVIFIIYLIFTGISFSGNFNALYTGYKTEEVLRAELENNRSLIIELQSTATKELNKKKENTVEKVKKLKKQIGDEIRMGTGGATGCGKNCKELVDSLGHYISVPIVPGLSNADRLADEVELRIDQNLELEVFLLDSVSQEIRDKIKNKSEESAKQIEDALNLGKNAQYEKTFYDTKLVYNELTSSIKAYTDTSIVFDKIDFDAKQLGKFGYTFQESSKDVKTNASLIYLLILASLVFDLLVPLILIIFTSADGGNSKNNNWFDNKKKSKTSFMENLKNQ